MMLRFSTHANQQKDNEYSYNHSKIINCKLLLQWTTIKISNDAYDN